MTLSRKWTARLDNQKRDTLWGYAFIAPQMIGFIIFIILPLITIFFFSTEQRNLLTGIVTPVGLGNFRTIFESDLLFRKVLINTLTFTAGLVPLNIGLALFLATLLNQKLRGITIFRVLFFSPVVTSAVAWAIVWRFMLQGDQGSVNQLLKLVGVDGPNWLRQPQWAMASVIVTLVIKNVGLNTIILLAALTNLPSEYHEAATVDGATRWQVFRRITLPLLSPTLLFVTVITVIGSLKVFDHIMLMTAGGPANSTMVLVYYIYYQAFQFFETGYASALAVILFALALVLTIIQWLVRGKAYDE